MFSISRAINTNFKKSLCRTLQCFYLPLCYRAWTMNVKHFQILQDKQMEKYNIPILGRQTRYQSTVPIVVRQDRNRFFTEIDGFVAQINYRVANGVMTITHTQVPKELGGHGIGKILAKVALDYALRKSLFLVIECEFVEHYISHYAPHYSKYMLQ